MVPPRPIPFWNASPVPRPVRRASRALAAGVAVLCLALPGALAAALDPDVSLPGATARLGFGGGWWPGQWVMLNLSATARGAFHLHAGGTAGTLRSSLGAWEADLDVPDSPGIRVATLPIPLFSERPVTLDLSGPTGRESVTLHAYGTPQVLNVSGTVNANSLDLDLGDVNDEPGFWMAGPRVRVPTGELSPPPAQVLSWVAGGALVSAAPGQLHGLSGVPAGALGLGGFGGEVSQARLSWSNLWRAVTPGLVAPVRGQGRLGLWAVAVYLLALVAYSARRFDASTFYVAALAAGLAGVLGLVAFQPAARGSSRETHVLAGAGGWGVEFVLRASFLMGGGRVSFPAGSYPIDLADRAYDENGVRVDVRPWQVVRAVEMPRAAIVPLVMRGHTLVNTGETTLADVFVVGSGHQEPLTPGEHNLINSDALSVPPEGLGGLAAALPDGTAIARDGNRVIIALPDGSSS
ncbi:MAG TPA: hypothetical protein VHN99_09620 [Deinococcales bacterium]|nr:hypothetical protein [Deinococcales bacterium]